MFEAEFANKLPELRDREDYLTSSIFGALKYLPPKDGIFSVLGEAFNFTLSKNLNEYLGSKRIFVKQNEIELCFWPRSFEFGEPDIVIIIHGGDKDYAIVVEVKYYSYKHGVGEDDQLKRYYAALNTTANRSTFTCDSVKHFSGDLLAIIYLTQFEAKEEIEDTLLAFDHDSRKDAQNKFFHLKWQTVARIIERLADNEKDSYKKKIYDDIYKLLEYKNLTPFKGFSGIREKFSPEHLVRLPIFIVFEESFSKKQFNGFSGMPDSVKAVYNKKIYYGG
jgi:hypothetical protein